MASDGSTRTPPKSGFKKPTKSSPGSHPPDFIPDPLVTNTNVYAAGVLPITYVIDEKTNTKIWKILLAIEHRPREKRLCLHPLAGKKEACDQNIPIKTAVREFIEECGGIYSAEQVYEQCEANCQQHRLFHYFWQSKMYLIFVYLPYMPDYDQKFQESTVEGKEAVTLVWYDFYSCQRAEGRLCAMHNGEKVRMSICAQEWFAESKFLEGLNSIRRITFERIAAYASPMYLPPDQRKTEGLDKLAEQLANTQIATFSTEQGSPEASSSESTSIPPKTPNTSDPPQ